MSRRTYLRTFRIEREGKPNWVIVNPIDNLVYHPADTESATLSDQATFSISRETIELTDFCDNDMTKWTVHCE